MIGLIKYHIDLLDTRILDLSICLLPLTANLFLLKLLLLISICFLFSLSQLGQSANFQSLWIGSQDEIVATWAKTAGPYRLIIPQNGQLLHMVHRGVNHGLDVGDDLHWRLV